MGGNPSNEAPAADTEQLTLAGLHVYVWRPPEEFRRHPLVIFSHGLHGAGSQSRFLTRELARNGYLVFAPDHDDAVTGRLFEGAPRRSTPNYGRADNWTDATWRDRAEDVRALMAALKADPYWTDQINWSRVGLAGHSLGGYTVLGLAGAWPSWKLPGVRAVLALSPSVAPFVRRKTLAGLDIPVMYQGGTYDYVITPQLGSRGGAFEQTPSPAFLVNFEGATHWSFTDIRHDGHPGIREYAVAFFDRYVKGNRSADPALRREGVADLLVK